MQQLSFETGPKKRKLTTSTAASKYSSNSCRLFIHDKATNIQFLIDTGADVSIVPRKFFPSSVKFDYNLVAANGAPICTFGIKALTVNLNLRRNFDHLFIIAAVDNAILGADFLSKYKLLVDLNKKRLIDETTTLFAHCVTRQVSLFIPKLHLIKGEYGNILNSFPSLITPPDFNHEPCHDVQHRIITQGSLPTARPRRLDPKKFKIAKEEFDIMVRLGICRPSSSPVASPLHMVPKKTPNEWRPCGDYRQLNAATLFDKYPLPNIHDCNLNLRNSKIFSKVDLERAYHQIPVAEEDIYKTAVITPFGLFEFLRMPFGVKNGAQTFQRFINKVLTGLDFTFSYLDDILVASSTPDEHRKHLQMLFTRLEKYGININPSKCIFGVSEIDFLGHIISPKGITPSHERIEAIKNFPPPKSVKQLQRFLGMVNFYHRFIPNIAQMAIPLYELTKGCNTKKNNKKNLVWCETHEKSFLNIKRRFQDTLLLVHPDPNAQVSICSDASGDSVGAVLQQKGIINGNH